jgi:hypothetical protein
MYLCKTYMAKCAMTYKYDFLKDHNSILNLSPSFRYQLYIKAVESHTRKSVLLCVWKTFPSVYMIRSTSGKQVPTNGSKCQLFEFGFIIILQRYSTRRAKCLSILFFSTVAAIAGPKISTLNITFYKTKDLQLPPKVVFYQEITKNPLLLVRF